MLYCAVRFLYNERKIIMSNKFFKGLKKGLEEAIAYEKGLLNLRSEEIEIPEPTIKYKKKRKNRSKKEPGKLQASLCT